MLLCIHLVCLSQLLNACSVTHSSTYIYKSSVVKTKGRLMCPVLIVKIVVLFLKKYAVTVMACL